ncbi:hypothetical protein H310_06514 [Aphanomyces invadans]|uniref:CNNM transmembrane domain-containing protein n=1 Tax=Aphanomyces invadans TaxID=157072 RepID=A0A024U6F6_9STRA|nr:hypothetical protein H310_06514 [Aphanomyces invadans]ETW01996.1 hypothetical protein H310_06514 [Aphanomyces invadans]|eukprot:XP_008869844.1 hypothetical protein H310_06514 [Aphanomyces invadans]
MDEEGDGGDSTALWVARIMCIVALVALSALFSGLTLGLMSLDKVGLEVVIGAGEDEHATEKEKAQADAAKRIAPIRRDGNLLLTTLLLGNVAVNSLLSILMADITSGFLGFIVSTIVIVLFGEIFPQAACSRHALAIGAKSIPVVKVIITMFYAFAKPVSMVLDRLLGQDVGTIFTKKELWKMLDIHVKQEMIDDEESWIMYGALHYKSQQVSAVMTPIDKVFMLVSTAKLNADTMREIYQSGFSRIPVWRKTRNDIIGLLFTKDLVFIDPEDAIPIDEFIQIFGRGVHRVWPDTNLGDLLKAFKMGRSRLALVHEVNNRGIGDPYLEAVGIVTLEDVVEEILQDTFRNEPNIDMRRHRKECRQVDFGKMRLLGVDVDVDRDMFLTPDEAEDLASHLIKHQPVFQLEKPNRGGPLTTADVQAMLVKCPLVEYGKCTIHGPDILSKAHVVNHCVVIMEGTVKVSTHHGLFKEIGLWSVLAPECLVSPENAYLPDYTATVSAQHPKILCLHIPRVEFQHMLYPINLGVRNMNSNVRFREPTPQSKRFRLPSLQIHPMPTSSPYGAMHDDPFEAKQSLLDGQDRSGM